MNEDNFAPDMKSGIQRMLSEKYAFIGGNYYFDSMDPETRCQVYQVGESLASVFNAVGLQKSKIRYEEMKIIHYIYLNKYFARFESNK